VNDDVDRLQDEVATRRARLTSSLGDLRGRLDDATDWRHWYRTRPVAAVALAGLLGWLLGRAGSDR